MKQADSNPEFKMLAAFGEATHDLAPTDDFLDRVMAEIGREPVSIGDSIVRFGPRALLWPALAVAACILLLLQTQQSFDVEVMANVDTVEFSY